MKRFSVWVTEVGLTCDVPRLKEYRASRMDGNSFTADNGQSKLVVRLAAGRRFFTELECALKFCRTYMKRQRESHLRRAEALLADLQKPDLGIEIVKHGSAVVLPGEAEEAEEEGIRRRRRARLAAGKCANCGRRPHKPDCTWCVVCLARKSTAKAERDRSRKELELCPNCSTEVEEGFVYCIKCRKKHRDRKRRYDERRRQGRHAGSNDQAEVQSAVSG